MEDRRQLIRDYLAKLGLESDIADIYAALQAHGPQSIAALARSARVERTRIYRLTDQLLASGLIELDSRGGRGIIKAAPVANLRVLIAERAAALQSLQDELSSIEQLLQHTTIQNPQMRATAYSGADGLRQLFEHQLAAGGDIYRFEQTPRQEWVGTPFYKSWLTAYNAADARLHCLRDPAVQSAITNWHTSYPGYRPQRTDSRLVTLPAGLEADVYGDTIARYYRSKQDSYGLAITDPALAEALRCLFRQLWQSAAA